MCKTSGSIKWSVDQVINKRERRTVPRTGKEEDNKKEGMKTGTNHFKKCPSSLQCLLSNEQWYLQILQRSIVSPGLIPQQPLALGCINFSIKCPSSRKFSIFMGQTWAPGRKKLLVYTLRRRKAVTAALIYHLAISVWASISLSAKVNEDCWAPTLKHLERQPWSWPWHHISDCRIRTRVMLGGTTARCRALVTPRGVTARVDTVAKVWSSLWHGEKEQKEI